MKKQKRPKSIQNQKQKMDNDDLQEIVGQLIEAGEEVPPDIQSQLEKLEKPELLKMVFSVTRTFAHSGPLPLASELHGYEDVCLGAADRIIKMAESEQTHRQGEETTAGNNYFTDRKIGYFLGAFLLAGLIGSGLYCVIIGEGLYSAGFLGVALLSVVGKFIPSKS